MDKLKGMAGGMGGAGGDQKATGGTGNEDYVDKVSLDVLRQVSGNSCLYFFHPGSRRY